MKQIFQKFLNQVIEMLAVAIEKKIERVNIKVQHRSSIDELIRVAEHTVFESADSVTISYNKCNRYSIVVIKDGKQVLRLNYMRDQKVVYEELIKTLIDKSI